MHVSIHIPYAIFWVPLRILKAVTRAWTNFLNATSRFLIHKACPKVNLDSLSQLLYYPQGVVEIDQPIGISKEYMQPVEN